MKQGTSEFDIEKKKILTPTSPDVPVYLPLSFQKETNPLKIRISFSLNS
jgi:hypothetical protein